MRQKTRGIGFTVFLWIILILLILILWSLFISGPNRIFEEDQAHDLAKIQKNVKEIQGLTRHQFDYVVYQGYTDSTLYWFDANGDEITTREIKTLNYEAAKEKAKKEYGIKAETIELGYGYDKPVYEIRSKKKMILLDYDTLERVYERAI